MVLRIQLVLNLLLIWFVRLKPIHGNVWNVKHVQNVAIQKMILNFYFVMIVIGNEEFHDLNFFFLLILVVIICIVALLLYQKHQKVIGVVNYVVLNLVNFNLDLIVSFLSLFFFNNSVSVLCIQYFKCCMSIYMIFIRINSQFSFLYFSL